MIPPLRNDCFALPPGVHWTPMDQALQHLDQRLKCVVGVESCPVSQADGRILAQAVTARRAHPSTANSAVDGYGINGGCAAGPHQFELLSGRSAAGDPFEGKLGPGQALRILTGAPLPVGVDTVVLQEDVVLKDAILSLNGPLQRGANARKVGEDVTGNQHLFAARHSLRPQDMGLLAATGVSQVQVRKHLRVAIFSTGAEVLEGDQPAEPAQVFDANRPMLIAMARRWGFEVLDLGIVADDAAAVQTALDAASQADVIITSGGASGGDEDHLSATLNRRGAMDLWRIAIKPGRPLALGMWRGTPVFGLPGNPVAAFVCAVLFARPSMMKMAGADFENPTSVMLPAAFEKTKKSGRREFLRARCGDGVVEVFTSEGSGRISGLSWANGLVELPDNAMQVKPGDLVKFLPFSGFGL